MSKCLWTPSLERKQGTIMSAFTRFVNERHGLAIEEFDDLHAFSVERQEDFWADVWDFCEVKAETRGDRVVVNEHKMPGARYFPDSRLNYAENMLQRRDDKTAMIFRGEDKVKRELTANEFYNLTARMHAALKAEGLEAGERVCAVVPNMPETMVAFLATASLGGIWSSCSPDFGTQGVLDRFGQVGPRVLVVCDGYHYNGKTHDIGDKVREILTQLPTVEKVIVIDYAGTADALASSLGNGVTLDAFIADHPAGEIEYAQLPFDHPLYILFSSGTTGVPKCIVHTAGGALLKHRVEQTIQGDIGPDDKLFYFTTCGWMMWNWLVSGLATGATLILYDGSPFYPDEKAIFDLAKETDMTIFGTSAKYIDAVKKTGWEPKSTHDLPHVRTMMSTGSTLAPESFDFVYESIKSDIHLASMSGGTDICGCFVGGNPWGSVWRSEIQSKCLGTAMDVFNDEGKPCPPGEKGELVCTRAFPSMPLMFWNDPEGEKYHNAYFDRFDNIWCHGDFAEWTENGGMVIHGRSDATLNPGGVRIGTAEIYAQVEKMQEVIEGLCIGQSWDDDTRIVLFVRLQDGFTLDEDLIKRIKTQVRTGASPRHVPAVIIAVDDIPRTKSGKITELAVRDVVHGREVKNKEALANPEALDLFRNLPELS